MTHTQIVPKFVGQLRDYQIPFCEKAVDMLHEKGTTILNVYPSWGKTIADLKN